MLKGKLSNKVAPAIVIDIDNLIVELPEEKPMRNWLFKKGRTIAEYLNLDKFEGVEVKAYKIKPDVYNILESLFFNDIMIYLFAERPKSFKEPLQKLFRDLPYTRLYVGDKKDREELLGRKNVKYYFYNDKRRSSFSSKGKEKWVESQYGIKL